MMSKNHWRPSATPCRLRARARLLQDIRAFFAATGTLEVETPIISEAGNTDPQIQSVRSTTGSYLRTSPEFFLKRLLAAGSGDIFELGRVFRKGESGRYHNPEFSLLEWYRTGCSYHQLMDEVAQLVHHCGHGKFDQWPQQRISYQALFQHYLDLDPFTVTVADLSATAHRHGITDIQLAQRQWLDLLLSHIIQPSLPEKCLTFVYDYPADQAALAKIRNGSPPVAERFELYLGRHELANGYQELTDAGEQRHRFRQDNSLRNEQNLPLCQIDQYLLRALDNGLPECAGVAVGVDRLLMAVCAAKSIDEVIAFPSSRA